MLEREISLDFQKRSWAIAGGQFDLIFAVSVGLCQFQGQFRGVVMLAEVGQADALESSAAVAGQFGGFGIGQMSAVAGDALLEPEGIIAGPQHVGVVVGFEEGSINAFEPGGQLGEDMAQVGKDSQPFPPVLHHKGHAVGPVVGGAEGMDLGSAKVKGLPGLEVTQIMDRP